MSLKYNGIKSEFIKKLRKLKYLITESPEHKNAPIFIWGAPRSGTTIMEHLFSLSRRVFTPTRSKISLDGYNVQEGEYIWKAVFGRKLKEGHNPSVLDIKLIKNAYYNELRNSYEVRAS